MPPATPLDEPASPDPAPRGTTGTRCAAATRTTCCTCVTSAAKTTHLGCSDGANIAMSRA